MLVESSVLSFSLYFRITLAYWKADIGGNFLVDQAQEYFGHLDEPITPRYMIEKAKVVAPQCPLNCTLRAHLPIVSSTYHVWAVQETLKEFVQSTLEVSPIPLCQKPTLNVAKTFVFPDGRTHIFQDEVHSLTEGMFDRNFDLLMQASNESCPEPTITEMAEHVLKHNDISIQYVRIPLKLPLKFLCKFLGSPSKYSCYWGNRGGTRICGAN